MICANPSKQSLPASHSCSQEVQRARLYFFDNDSVSPSTCPSRTPRYRRRPANTHRHYMMLVVASFPLTYSSTSAVQDRSSQSPRPTGHPPRVPSYSSSFCYPVTEGLLLSSTSGSPAVIKVLHRLAQKLITLSSLLHISSYPYLFSLVETCPSMNMNMFPDPPSRMMPLSCMCCSLPPPLYEHLTGESMRVGFYSSLDLTLTQPEPPKAPTDIAAIPDELAVDPDDKLTPQSDILNEIIGSAADSNLEDKFIHMALVASTCYHNPRAIAYFAMCTMP
jgi:hypothetical protein